MSHPLGLRKISSMFSGSTFYHGLGTREVIFQIIRSDGLLFSPGADFVVNRYDNHLDFFVVKKTPAGTVTELFTFTNSYITVIG